MNLLRTCPAVLLLLAGACASAPTEVPAEAAAAPSESAEAPRPAFVAALIERFEGAPVANPPASVWSYRYRGQTVWYVPPTCCDVPSQLYADDGEMICEPDGGFTGRGDGRCADFAAARSEERLVWRDARAD